MNNLASHLQNLTTIKDFDFAISESPKDFSRVSAITTNVTKSDVDLIIWLLLEKEFGIDGSKVREEDRHEEEDISAGAGDAPDAQWIQSDGRNHSQRFHTKLSKREQVLKYAESLLDAVAVNIPFRTLSQEQRHKLFQLFCSSSNLLRQEKYSSITDLYNAVRRRSKFREDFIVANPLGNGNFGTVWSVKKKSTSQSQTYALKKVILSFDLAELIPMILNESSILKALQGNEHVVRYYDSWFAIESNDEYNSLSPGDGVMMNPAENSTSCSSYGTGTDNSYSSSHVEYEEGSYVFYLLMEECWISLKEWKASYPTEFSILTPQLIHRIAFQLIDGVEWIHSKGFLHLDINPKNIIWKNETRTAVVITDFGLAVKGPTFSERVGTTPYCSPERILNAKSDIYSLGVSLFEICQQFATRAEFFHKLEVRDVKSGIEFLDQMLPLMIQHRHQQRLSARELKVKFFHS